MGEPTGDEHGAEGPLLFDIPSEQDCDSIGYSMHKAIRCEENDGTFSFRFSRQGGRRSPQEEEKGEKEKWTAEEGGAEEAPEIKTDNSWGFRTTDTETKEDQACRGDYRCYAGALEGMETPKEFNSSPNKKDHPQEYKCRVYTQDGEDRAWRRGCKTEAAWKLEPPKGANGICQRINPNPRNEEVLARWSIRVQEKLGKTWKAHGFYDREQMERCIKEDIPFIKMAKQTSASAMRRSPDAGYIAAPKEDMEGCSYPMLRQGDFRPLIERDSAGRKRASAVRLFKKWESKLSWFRINQMGPKKLLDGEGRCLVSIFISPRNTHDCGSFLFSGCWACWGTACPTCYFMYANGAPRWGPSACGECPPFHAYDTEGRNERYLVKYGTNSADGFNIGRSESICWILVYDLQHKDINNIVIHKESTCWGGQQENRDRYAAKYSQYDNVSSDDDEPGTNKYVPAVMQVGADVESAASYGAGAEPVPGMPAADGNAEGNISSTTDGGEAAQDPLRPGLEQPRGDGLIDSFVNLGLTDDVFEELSAGCSNILSGIELHPEFERLLDSFNGSFPTEEIYGGDVGSYDAWGVPTGEWTCPLQWNGGAIPPLGGEETLDGSSRFSNEAQEDDGDLDRVETILSWLDLSHDEESYPMEGTEGPGNEDRSHALLVQGGGTQNGGREGHNEIGMEISGTEEPAGPHPQFSRPANGASSAVQNNADQDEEEISEQTEAPRKSRSKRRQIRRENALARRVSFEAAAGGAIPHDAPKTRKRRVRDDTPRPKEYPKRHREDRGGPGIQYKDPHTGRIVAYTGTRTPQAERNPIPNKGYYTSRYRRGDRRR